MALLNTFRLTLLLLVVLTYYFVVYDGPGPIKQRKAAIPSTVPDIYLANSNNWGNETFNYLKNNNLKAMFMVSATKLRSALTNPGQRIAFDQLKQTVAQEGHLIGLFIDDSFLAMTEKTSAGCPSNAPECNYLTNADLEKIYALFDRDMKTMASFFGYTIRDFYHPRKAQLGESSYRAYEQVEEIWNTLGYRHVPALFFRDLVQTTGVTMPTQFLSNLNTKYALLLTKDPSGRTVCRASGCQALLDKRDALIKQIGGSGVPENLYVVHVSLQLAAIWDQELKANLKYAPGESPQISSTGTGTSTGTDNIGAKSAPNAASRLAVMSALMSLLVITLILMQ